MAVVWLVWGAKDTYQTTALAPLVSYVFALVVSLVKRDSLATRQLAIILMAAFVLMLFGAVVVLPLPWAVVTFAFVFAAAVARNLALLILGLASSVGVLLNAWPSAYADAGPGLSMSALSPALGAAAILVASRVLARG